MKITWNKPPSPEAMKALNQTICNNALRDAALRDKQDTGKPA